MNAFFFQFYYVLTKCAKMPRTILMTRLPLLEDTLERVAGHNEDSTKTLWRYLLEAKRSYNQQQVEFKSK